MRIIRRNDMVPVVRDKENRSVRFYLHQSVTDCSWLTVTGSEKHFDLSSTEVGLHAHPDSDELIIFLESAHLEVEGTRFDFGMGDAIILAPGERHGARALKNHNCICVLWGNSEPSKTTNRSE